MAVELNKLGLPTYVKTEHSWHKIVNGISEVSIFNYGEKIEINIIYDVPRNSYLNDYAKKITQREFDKKLKEVKNMVWKLKA
jgi:hypothetical protein